MWKPYFWSTLPQEAKGLRAQQKQRAKVRQKVSAGESLTTCQRCFLTTLSRCCQGKKKRSHPEIFLLACSHTRLIPSLWMDLHAIIYLCTHDYSGCLPGVWQWQTPSSKLQAGLQPTLWWDAFTFFALRSILRRRVGGCIPADFSYQCFLISVLFFLWQRQKRDITASKRKVPLWIIIQISFVFYNWKWQRETENCQRKW